jgi:hypothetical protein
MRSAPLPIIRNGSNSRTELGRRSTCDCKNADTPEADPLRGELAVIDWLNYRLKLSSKFRAKKAIQGRYDDERGQLLGLRDAAVEISKLNAKEEMDLALINDEIAVLQTRYYCAVAIRRSIPLPERASPNWDVSKLRGVDILTTLGLSTMRSTIRRDFKESLDTWAPIVSLLVAVAALIVAAASVFINVYGRAGH